MQGTVLSLICFAATRRGAIFLSPDKKRLLGLPLSGLVSIELWNLTRITAIACCIPLTFFGACDGAMSNHRSERGLWILSSDFAAMVGFFIAAFLFGISRDMLRPGFFADLLLMELAWVAALLILLLPISGSVEGHKRQLDDFKTIENYAYYKVVPVALTVNFQCSRDVGKVTVKLGALGRSADSLKWGALALQCAQSVRR